MFKKLLSATVICAVTFTSLLSYAQENKEALKKEILKKVEERLKAEREKTLEKIEQLIDEKLSGESLSADKVKERMKELDREIEKLKAEKEKLAKTLGKHKLEKNEEDEDNARETRITHADPLKKTKAERKMKIMRTKKIIIKRMKRES